jgi:hypothetical protein
LAVTPLDFVERLTYFLHQVGERVNELKQAFGRNLKRLAILSKNFLFFPTINAD